MKLNIKEILGLVTVATLVKSTSGATPASSHALDDVDSSSRTRRAQRMLDLASLELEHVEMVPALDVPAGIVVGDGIPEESGGSAELTATVTDVLGLGVPIPAGVRALGSAQVADVPVSGQNARRLASTTFVDSNFLGFDFDDNGLQNGGIFTIPPDPCGAAGTSTLVAVVNSMIEILNKDDGSLIARSGLQAFFGVTGSVFDPKIIYDDYEQRFVVVALFRQFSGSNPDVNNLSVIFLAVSKDDNPSTLTGADWFFKDINSKFVDPGTGVEHWADYPGFEEGEEALYITTNMFGFPGVDSYPGPVVWIVPKGVGMGGFYDDGPLTLEAYHLGNVNVATLMPAKIQKGPDNVLPGAEIGTYLVAYSGYNDGTDAFVLVIKIISSLGGPGVTSINLEFIPIGVLGVIDDVTVEVPPAPQLGTADTIKTNDRRALDAVWQNNRLFFTTTVVNDSGEAEAHWFELDTDILGVGPTTLVDQGGIDGEDIATGTFTFFPSVAVNKNDQVMFGFSASAPTIYAGAYAAGRHPGDLAGTVRGSMTVKAGQEPYLRTFSGDRNRWGDYSSVCVDPSDSTGFWVFNEYAEVQGTDIDGETGRWGTAWGHVRFCDADGGMCINGDRGGGGQGDPHFKTWTGAHFDYHGECDLILIQSAAFESGLGLDVHIRTKIRRDMSYISSAALRIGSDVLEVASKGVYYLNGVAGADLPAEFSGLAFSHTQPTDLQHVFDVHLGGRERIKIKTYKDFVSVLVEKGRSKHFGDSVGLMGDFEMGKMIARDGNTVLNDPNAFGQEWQVLETERTLFQTNRLPQHPQVCKLTPPKPVSQLRRRLSESTVEELAAEKACAHWVEGKDDCVFDVLMTGDLNMAVVGAY